MAVKETIVYTRPNTNTLWIWESVTPSSNSVTSDHTQTTSFSEDNLQATIVKQWANNDNFVSVKSVGSSISENQQYFNFIVDNNIKIQRTIEII